MLKNNVLSVARYTKQLENKKHPTKKTQNTFANRCVANKNKRVNPLSKTNIKPSGKKNHGKKMQKDVMKRLNIKKIESNPITNRVNFKNNFIPSVIGVNKPNKNKAGPILSWVIANILRSHKLTYPHKTAKTSINIITIMYISKQKSILFK
ncbi:unnamed protein product [Trypanosoma congolense IL3000]|uniref:WGS project CAEQ00000000 data, annotated contig 1132 n=1 Tax=Trypanosoma congolense (strain IL3000) TaxID=1068625 RepID=F9W402_TRYCI|nr:unnamed protein product [Trypanosoma congolense IL3000]CCD14647.1 unnamed protein product [Trypanosoma congolense IL3000]CCD16746.1 unnamed protein product [Trypanosoma congolense IL3000]